MGRQQQQPWSSFSALLGCRAGCRHWTPCSRESHLASSAKRGPNHGELCCSLGVPTQHPWCPWPPSPQVITPHCAPLLSAGWELPQTSSPGQRQMLSFPQHLKKLSGKKAARSSKSGKPLANVLPSAREIWVQRKEKVLVVTVNEEAQG